MKTMNRPTLGLRDSETCCDAQLKPSRVFAALDDVGHHIEQLEATIERLGQRLGPVLSVCPANPCEKDPPPEGSCDLERSIIKLGKRVARAGSCLGDIISRLEV